MGKVNFLEIFHQFVCQLPVIEKAVVLPVSHPGSKVHLIDRIGPVQTVLLFSVSHPVCILLLVAFNIGYDGRRIGRVLTRKSIWVRLFRDHVVVM